MPDALFQWQCRNATGHFAFLLLTISALKVPRFHAIGGIKGGYFSTCSSSATTLKTNEQSRPISSDGSGFLCDPNVTKS
jgi:hypothetical protein